MAGNLPLTTATTPANADSTRGMPYYEKLRRDLRETLQKKRLLDKNMVSIFLFSPVTHVYPSATTDSFLRSAHIGSTRRLYLPL